MSDLIYKTAVEHSSALKRGDYSASDLAKACLEQAEKTKNLGIFLHLDRESILKQAAESDKRRASGKTLGPLDGIPVAIKDNICVKDAKTTCASRILENFIAPYDAAVIEKLKGAGAVLFGRANLDEFAMGSSTENSSYQKTLNPWNPEYVPGGSSGGSAAAISASVVPLALGSDTGGSIRQPAALCGLVGIKPTYGRVSRYGLVAFASSLDQIGPIAKTVEDASLLLSVIQGYDHRDSTSHPVSEKMSLPASVTPLTDAEWKNLRIGVDLPEEGAEGFEKAVIAAGKEAVEYCRSRGAKIVPIHSKFAEYSIPIYYILATAEASSNLSRYDGIRYGHKSGTAQDLMEVYVRSRTEGFGPEVKRRILLGTFVLSSGYYDAFYNKAMQARKLIQTEYAHFFEKVDVILQPTSPTAAFKIGEKSSNPIAMYKSDLLTIAANLAGVPAMNIPAGLNEKNLPLGLQLTANFFDEEKMMRIASSFQQVENFTLDFLRRSVKKKLISISAKDKKPSPEEKEAHIISSTKKLSGTKTNSRKKNIERLKTTSEVKKIMAKKKATKKKTAKKKAGKKKAAKKKAKKKPAKRKPAASRPAVKSAPASEMGSPSPFGSTPGM